MAQSVRRTQIFQIQEAADDNHTHEKEVVVLWLRAQILEDRLLPVALHVVPVVNHAVADGVVHPVPRRLRVGEGLIADEEVEVFDTTLGCKMAGFGRNSWCTRRLGSSTTSGNRSREYTAELRVLAM